MSWYSGGFKAVSKRIPVVGAVVTAGFGIVETVSVTMDKGLGAGVATFSACAAETVGNIVGFGVGDAARQVVVEGVDAIAGDKYRPEDAFLVTAAKAGYEYVTEDDEPEIAGGVTKNTEINNANIEQGDKDMNKLEMVGKVLGFGGKATVETVKVAGAVVKKAPKTTAAVGAGVYYQDEIGEGVDGVSSAADSAVGMYDDVTDTVSDISQNGIMGTVMSMVGGEGGKMGDLMGMMKGQNGLIGAGVMLVTSMMTGGIGGMLMLAAAAALAYANKDELAGMIEGLSSGAAGKNVGAGQTVETQVTPAQQQQMSKFIESGAGHQSLVNSLGDDHKMSLNEAVRELDNNKEALQGISPQALMNSVNIHAKNMSESQLAGLSEEYSVKVGGLENASTPDKTTQINNFLDSKAGHQAMVNTLGDDHKMSQNEAGRELESNADALKGVSSEQLMAVMNQRASHMSEEKLAGLKSEYGEKVGVAAKDIDLAGLGAALGGESKTVVQNQQKEATGLGL